MLLGSALVGNESASSAPDIRFGAYFTTSYGDKLLRTNTQLLRKGSSHANTSIPFYSFPCRQARNRRRDAAGVSVQLSPRGRCADVGSEGGISSQSENCASQGSRQRRHWNAAGHARRREDQTRRQRTAHQRGQDRLPDHGWPHGAELQGQLHVQHRRMAARETGGAGEYGAAFGGAALPGAERFLHLVDRRHPDG